MTNQDRAAYAAVVPYGPARNISPALRDQGHATNPNKKKKKMLKKKGKINFEKKGPGICHLRYSCARNTAKIYL